MGKDKREQKMLNISQPGPGTYIVNTTVGEGPKINLSSKLPEIKQKLCVPGPGAYNANPQYIYRGTLKAGIGLGQRSHNLARICSMPGPDAYQKQEMIRDGPRYGFLKSKRNTEKITKSPGPGAYKIPCSIGEVPAYDRHALSKSYDFQYV